MCLVLLVSAPIKTDNVPTIYTLRSMNCHEHNLVFRALYVRSICVPRTSRIQPSSFSKFCGVFRLDLGPVNPLSQTIYFLTFVITASEFHSSLLSFPHQLLPTNEVCREYGRETKLTFLRQNLLSHSKSYFFTAKISISLHQLALITTNMESANNQRRKLHCDILNSNFCHLPARWFIF